MHFVSAVATGSRMLCRSKPWRRPRARRAIERALHLLLQVDDRRRSARARSARRNAVNSRQVPRRERQAAPAPEGDRDHVADARIEPHQRHEAFLGDPVDRKPGAMRRDVAHQRERMHDVAERRGPHDQHRAHRAPSRRAACPARARGKGRRIRAACTAAAREPPPWCRECPNRFPCRSSSSPATPPTSWRNASPPRRSRRRRSWSIRAAAMIP